MKRFEIALLFGILASIVISSYTAFAGECADVRQQVVRLHVLANSNSEEDQSLKLAVRDAVLTGTADIFTLSADKAQVEALAMDNLASIEAIARREVLARGYDYPVRAVLVNMFFETRVYDGVTLPAGFYDAVRITIGSGEGENWWCVMFPPMCIPAATGDEGGALQEQIQRLGTRPQYQPKFAVVELVESIGEKLGGRKESPVIQ